MPACSITVGDIMEFLRAKATPRLPEILYIGAAAQPVQSLVLTASCSKRQIASNGRRLARGAAGSGALPVKWPSMNFCTF